MAKVVNLLGIRNKVILCRTKYLGEFVYTVMREITDKQEQELDELESVNINNKIVSKEDIYCYGQIDVNNEEDTNYLKKFNIINLDDENPIHANYNYNEGNVLVEGHLAKMITTWNPVEWFKYNYLLLGKPARIIIYKCKKCDL